MDYEKLGFKCGVEIHQQLEGKKLFCDCPTLNSSKEPDIKIVRRLRAVAGETGEIDIAAKHEMIKGRKIIYEACSSSSCLVELDDEPPHPVNQEALETALEIALLLNAKIVDTIQFMRKTVVDGSNTAGFQRTALIATNGYVDTSLGKVSIPTICLEEEAAKRIKDDKDSVTFRLDRLGVALVEIGTGTEIKNPEHAKEVASILGMMLRSTEKVKRGLGTIRQDVNISIAKGARTEIKGFQELRSIPKVIEYEVERQLNDIKSGKKIEQTVRKAEPNLTTSFLRPMPGAARMYPETDIPVIRIAKERIEKIRKKLPKLLTEKEKEFEKKYGLGKELAKELISHEMSEMQSISEHAQKPLVFDKFEDYVGKFKNIEPQQIASILINVPKEIKTRFDVNTASLTDENFEEVLRYLNEGKIAKEAVIELLTEAAKGKKVDISKFKTISLGNLEEEIKEIISQKPGLTIGAYMGLAMAKYRGKVDGKKVMEILRKFVK